MIELDEAVAMPTRSRVPGEIAVGVAATLAALGVWLAWTQVGGVGLTVRSADATREVGAMSVALTALVASVTGVLLARLLEWWLPRGCAGGPSWRVRCGPSRWSGRWARRRSPPGSGW